MAKNLFIGNLSYGTSEAKLTEAFSKYGASNARIIEGRGFGFIEVEDDQAAAAMDEMNETELDGRKIVVNEARPRENRGGGGGGHRGGGGGHRGGGGGGYRGGRDNDRGRSNRGGRW